jgi:hypothetical protein
MTNITVNQLIGLMATDHLFDFVKLELYDEVHQISETTDEHAMRQAMPNIIGATQSLSTGTQRTSAHLALSARFPIQFRSN